MIELPEARVLAEQLAERLTGRQVTGALAGHTEHKFTWYFGEPENYGDLLTGLTVTGAEARGGNVEIALGDDYRLLLQDGAPPRLWGPGDKLPARHQLHMTFDDGNVLTVTVRMYGGISAFRDGENDNPYYLVGKEKPSPYSDAFTFAYFQSLTDFPGFGKASAKAFLATEQRIPGLGNGVLQDILFTCGVHPKRRMADLSEGGLHRMYDAVESVLWDMVLAGGRDAERDLYGCPGRYHPVLGKKTVGTPCPVCGAVIEKANYLGGSIYFCPTCQPL